jgi:hypothetical protein
MTYSWHFNKHRAGDPMDDPIQGEYFSDESISNPGDSLIREGTQNSLDAVRNADRILVRLRVSGENAPARDASPFFEGLWNHLAAKRNGLRQSPSPEDPCPYLLFEDFGTTGLTGDPLLDWSCDPVKNHFFHFFRAAGRSDKGDKDRGCCGVGKTVFPRSSRVNGWFGLTVPEGASKALLMGRIIMKHHEVEGFRYTPNGFFGVPPASGDGIVKPIEDPDFIQQFMKAFDIQRGLTEPGLSIVVPWYEIEDLTDDNLIRSVVRHCFWPILKGQLEVWIETPTTQRILKKENLTNETGKLGIRFRPSIRPLAELADGRPRRFHSVLNSRFQFRLILQVGRCPRDKETLTAIKDQPINADQWLSVTFHHSKQGQRMQRKLLRCFRGGKTSSGKNHLFSSEGDIIILTFQVNAESAHW